MLQFAFGTISKRERKRKVGFQLTFFGRNRLDANIMNNNKKEVGFVLTLYCKCGRTMLRHEWADSTGVIPRPHRKPTCLSVNYAETTEQILMKFGLQTRRADLVATTITNSTDKPSIKKCPNKNPQKEIDKRKSPFL
uniref:SFRICE_034848 n=1 Tax=Spodoptera frugiperda TaxID=7108 RepID=A0A2H1UZM5_SPOFR